jgi:hypothetical protein
LKGTTGHVLKGTTSHVFNGTTGHVLKGTTSHVFKTFAVYFLLLEPEISYNPSLERTLSQ